MALLTVSLLPLVGEGDGELDCLEDLEVLLGLADSELLVKKLLDL